MTDENFNDIHHFRTLCSTLLRHELTPLLRQEVELCAASHGSALDQFRDLTVDDLERLKHERDRIKKHWHDINGTIQKAAYRWESIDAIIRVISLSIVSEYCDQRPFVCRDTYEHYFSILGGPEDRAKAVEALTAGDESSLDDLYELDIGFALKELLVDRSHVEIRLRAVSNGVNITGMQVRNQDWKELRKTVEADKKLLSHFSISASISLEQRKTIAQRMDETLRREKASEGLFASIKGMFTEF